MSHASHNTWRSVWDAVTHLHNTWRSVWDVVTSRRSRHPNENRWNRLTQNENTLCVALVLIKINTQEENTIPRSRCSESQSGPLKNKCTTTWRNPNKKRDSSSCWISLNNVGKDLIHLLYPRTNHQGTQVVASWNLPSAAGNLLFLVVLPSLLF